MDPPSSVLISLPSSREDTITVSNGISGIAICENWILTHGTALLSKIKRSTELANFLSNLEPGKLTLVPKIIKKDLKFRILQDKSSFENSNCERNICEDTGHVIALWICPLLKETLENHFETWDFEKLADYTELLLPLFLLLNLNVDESFDTEISRIEKTLSLLSDRALGKLDRGCCVEIRSTPFGNPVFIDSVTRGVVSNIIGTKGCVILTDASALPGCEGGPVYVIGHYDDKVICGMVIASLARCRGEFADYTFVICLAACLQRILSKESIGYLKCADDTIVNSLDRNVAVVRCGNSWGTGILIDKGTGVFLTCSHVITQAAHNDVRIEMRGESYRSAWAEVIYRSTESNPYDVAILRVKPGNLEPSLMSIKLAERPASKGEPVISVGFPFFSTIQATITSGIVSNSNDCMLQTTCCVQSGASGGPIVRHRTHEMLGMIVSNAISPNGSVLYPRLCMALPTTILKEPLEQYLRTGDLQVFQCLTTDDLNARKIWNLHAFLPSKM